MTAHELAQLLLAGPDHMIAVTDSDGEPNACDLTVEDRTEPVWHYENGDRVLNEQARFEEKQFIYIF